MQKLTPENSAEYQGIQDAYQSLNDASQTANKQYDSAVNKRRMCRIAAGLPVQHESDEVPIAVLYIYLHDHAGCVTDHSLLHAPACTQDTQEVLLSGG